MASSADVAWIRPATSTDGHDHLGTQAPCTTLYSQLLPGITSGTKRARYYAFHPWLLWSFEHRYDDHSIDEFRRVFRRAECLFALAAIRHERVVNDKRGHVGIDGVRELLRIPDDANTIVLNTYATLTGPSRYLKKPLGSLEQYYLGPLQELLVLDYSSIDVGHLPGYDRKRGQAIAEAFAQCISQDVFFDMLEAPHISWAELDELAPLCPCGICNNPTERELLLDLFFARTPQFQTGSSSARRASLVVMLDLIGRYAWNVGSFEQLLRGSSYAGALPNGLSWDLSGPLLQARQGWGTYQRNELLSVAVQGLFAAILCATNRDRRGALRQTGDAADVAISLLSSSDLPLARPLCDVISELRETLPSVTNWQHSEHELQRGWHLVSLGLHNDCLDNLAEQSIRILLSLLARDVGNNPYADFELHPDHFNPQEIHLLSFRRLFHGSWSNLTLGNWIRWLAVHWCVEQHLRVALRKLRRDHRDTFRIRPLESEFRIVKAPQPTFTFPRVVNTVQILRDLGLIDYNVEGAVVLTALGSQELEACRGT